MPSLSEGLGTASLRKKNSSSGCTRRNMQNSNIELLKNVAKRLGPLLSEVVFVGGCTTGLFITDQAAAEGIPSFDVGVIGEIKSYAHSHTFSERWRALWVA